MAARRTEVTVRFYANDSKESQQVEGLLQDRSVKYLRILTPLESVQSPAVEYRGEVFEGLAEIATSLFCPPD